MSTVREEIAKNLLYYRKKNGYTQKQLAEKLGVKNSAVSNWENGQNSTDIETLCKACEIFCVTLNDMYGRYSSAEEYTEHEKAVIFAYRSNPNMQSAVDKLLGVVAAFSPTLVYRAARSEDNHADEIVNMDSKQLGKLKNAPETDEDLL